MNPINLQTFLRLQICYIYPDKTIVCLKLNNVINFCRRLLQPIVFLHHIL